MDAHISVVTRKDDNNREYTALRLSHPDVTRQFERKLSAYDMMLMLTRLADGLKREMEHKEYGFNCVIDFAVNVESVPGDQNPGNTQTLSEIDMTKEFEKYVEDDKVWTPIFIYDGGKFLREENGKNWQEKTDQGSTFKFKELSKKDSQTFLLDNFCFCQTCGAFNIRVCHTTSLGSSSICFTLCLNNFSIGKTCQLCRT